MVASGTSGRNEVKRENLALEQNQVETSLEVGALMTLTLLRVLTVVGRLFSDKGISNGRILCKKV